MMFDAFSPVVRKRIDATPQEKTGLSSTLKTRNFHFLRHHFHVIFVKVSSYNVKMITSDYRARFLEALKSIESLSYGGFLFNQLELTRAQLHVEIITK